MTDIIEAHGRTYTRCCGTCRHWDQSKQIPFKGFCKISEGQLSPRVATLDLALCSKWQEKDEG